MFIVGGLSPCKTAHSATTAALARRYHSAMSTSVFLVCLQAILVLTCPLDNLSYTENPFSSTHSLDANPFDDPTPSASAPKVDAARIEELERRERDLERREQELGQKADYIRKHGRNNWPPCSSCTVLLRFKVSLLRVSIRQSTPSFSTQFLRRYQRLRGP